MKTVFITGVNRGLGKELFRVFLRNGFYVFGVLRNKTDYDRLMKTLPKNAELILADISKDDSIAIINRVVKQNNVDLIINNAGIGGEASKLENVKTDEIIRLMNVHVLGVLRTVKALKSNLLMTDDPMVINLNSRLGSITRQGSKVYKDLTVSYSYRIAKASQNMLTNCLRVEFEDKIKFISLHPGKLKTEIAQVDADTEPQYCAKMILDQYKKGMIKEENGIVELSNSLIEW